MKGSLSPSPSPDGDQQTRLACWLHEWRLFMVLSESTLSEDTSFPNAGSPVFRHDENGDESLFALGDILLLHPAMEPSTPRYIAILEMRANNTCLAIPFGLMSAPAIPEEIRTDRLAYCWRIDQLTGEERDWLLTGAPGDRTGPPLRQPTDPRWDYLEMESEFRQRVSGRRDQTVTYDISEAVRLQKAAEDGVPYGRDNNITSDA